MTQSWLRYIGLHGSEEAVSLSASRLRIGRARGNELILAEDTVSRFHAEILNLGGERVITDLGSKGGTWVNGERIFRRSLRNKDIINIGPFALHFEERPATEADSPEGRTVLGDTRERITWSQPVLKDGARTELDAEARGRIEAARAEIAQYSDPTEAVDRLVQLAMEAVVAERGFFFLKSADGLLPLVEIDPKIKIRRLNISTTIVDRVLAEEVAVITADALMDPELDGSKSVVDLGIRSALCAPVRGRSAVAGFIYLDTTDPEHRFNKRDLASLIAFAEETSRVLVRERIVS